MLSATPGKADQSPAREISAYRKDLVTRVRVYRNCIGFGSGILTESFERNVLSESFVVCFLISYVHGPWLAGWAGGVAGLPLGPAGWLGLGAWQGSRKGLWLWGLELGWDLSHTFNENSKLMKMQFHTISIYPALEGLGFRV